MGQDSSPTRQELFIRLYISQGFHPYKKRCEKLEFRITFVPVGTDLLVLNYLRLYIFPSRIPVVFFDRL
jgi:hypothetical protein